MPASDTFVIAGGGLAGAKAAEAGGRLRAAAAKAALSPQLAARTLVLQVIARG